MELKPIQRIEVKNGMFCLSPEGYTAMADNMKEIVRYTTELQDYAAACQGGQ